MIIEPAELLTDLSEPWAIIKIDKGCWVVITRQELLDGLKRGRRFRRQVQLAARLKARQPSEDRDDGRDP